VIIKTPSTYDFKWNIFRSFSPRLWVAVGVTMALLSVSLASVDLFHCRHGLRDDGDYSLTKAMLIVVGAFCQKGTITRRLLAICLRLITFSSRKSFCTAKSHLNLGFPTLNWLISCVLNELSTFQGEKFKYCLHSLSLLVPLNFPFRTYYSSV
jgi:hypothetical protein